VGYKLYLKMLNRAIQKAKGEKIEERKEAEVSLQGSFYIPRDYISEEDERIELYRKISSAENLEEIDKIENEIKDRFGKPPQNVTRILNWAKIKISAEYIGIKKVEEGIQSFTCEFEKTPGKDQIRELVENISGLKFSYKNKYLSVSVPRDAIFDFLETLNN
jgi:transcription-repair coupling factor (superfamily II helicase)